MPFHPKSIPQIFPSLLSSNLMYLHDEITALMKAGIKCLHLDVMDHHYVPNLTFGPLLAKSIHQAFHIDLDIHLMVSPVDELIREFAPFAKRISIHPDATIHLDRSLQLIKELGCDAGLALNPHSSLDSITWCSSRLNYVLMMTVNPGFGGQSLIPYVIPKIQQFHQQYPHIPIAVDGGVNLNTIGTLSSAGATDFVVGHALFQHADYAHTVHELHQRALDCQKNQ